MVFITSKCVPCENWCCVFVLSLYLFYLLLLFSFIFIEYVINYITQFLFYVLKTSLAYAQLFRDRGQVIGTGLTVRIPAP